MHIQPEQFIALLSEASGIEEDKIRKQLDELISEIKHAVAEGEAYELEEFGIFSQLGDRLVFIPSPALETEINFKYVGMEPIEMEAPTNENEDEKESYDPFEGLAMDADSETKRDPFSGLIEELDEDEIPDPSQQEETFEAETESVADDSSDDEEDFDDPFAELEKDEESAEPKGIELPDEDAMTEEAPGPLQWGISAHTESDESADRLLSSLMGDDPAEESMPDPEDAFEDPVADEDDSDITESFDPEKTLQDDLETVLGDEEPNDFEDPFAGIDDDLSDSDEEEKNQGSVVDDDDDDILPVITNISSDLPEPEEKPEEEKKKKSGKEPSDKTGEPAPLWLWVVLFIVVIGGGVFALQYFEVIRIPGISQDQAVTQTQPVSPPPPVTQATPEQNEPEADTNDPVEPEPTPSAEEPSGNQAEAVVEATAGSDAAPSETTPVNMPETVPGDQSLYGLTGVTSSAANNGYTIVLYSLSVEENAFREQARLQERGYRALVKPVPSSQYGTLWRVSIGQFASQRDAAIATDQLDDSFNQNIFISKITN